MRTYKLINLYYKILPQGGKVELPDNKKDDDFYQRQWRFVIETKPKDWKLLVPPTIKI